MARIRSLKPEFFTSEQVVSVSVEARYLFQGMWVFGDDDGYIAASPLQLKMKIFPGDSADVPALLEELIDVELVELMEADQGPIYWVPSFRNHQKPKYPTPTKFTVDGVSLTERSPRIPPGLPQASGSTSLREERRGEESRGVERSGEENTSSSEPANADSRPEWIQLLDTRQDVAQILDVLDRELRANGNKVKPYDERTKTNVDAARLLIDRDGRSVEQVVRAIEWCQSDEFWRSNILSMSKLREKYDQLRLAAERKREGTGNARGDRMAANLRLVRELEASERGIAQ